MALVIIQIQDTPDGALVRQSIEPPLNVARNNPTRAEVLGAAALSAIEAEINATKPVIEIFSADQMPH